MALRLGFRAALPNSSPPKQAASPRLWATQAAVESVRTRNLLPFVDRVCPVAAGLLQATSLPYIVAATGIGKELGILSSAVGAAMVVAGLLSVILFPLGALTILRAGKPAGPDDLDHL